MIQFWGHDDKGKPKMLGVIGGIATGQPASAKDDKVQGPQKVRIPRAEVLAAALEIGANQYRPSHWEFSLPIETAEIPKWEEEWVGERYGHRPECLQIRFIREMLKEFQKDLWGTVFGSSRHLDVNKKWGL